MLWRLHTAIVKEMEKDIVALLESEGDTVQVISGGPYSLPSLPPTAAEQPCIALTTLQDARFKLKRSPAVPLSYYQEGRYDVSFWLPHAVRHNLPVYNSTDCFWMPFGLLQTIPHKFPLFIKSDAGHKSIVGQVFNSVDDLKHYDDISPHQLMFCAPPKLPHVREYRFWIVEKEIAGFSAYGWNQEENERNSEEIEKAKRIVDLVTSCAWTPDVAYVVDIGQSPSGQFEILEYNCMTTSGLYAGVDIKTLFHALRNVATKEWNGEITFEEV